MFFPPAIPYILFLIFWRANYFFRLVRSYIFFFTFPSSYHSRNYESTGFVHPNSPITHKAVLQRVFWTIINNLRNTRSFWHNTCDFLSCKDNTIRKSIVCITSLFFVRSCKICICSIALWDRLGPIQVLFSFLER